MIKVWLTLGFSLVTAVITMIAGEIAEARLTVMLSRAGLAFIVAAVVSYGVQTILMRYSLPEGLNSPQDLSENTVLDLEQHNVSEGNDAVQDDHDTVAVSDTSEGSQGEQIFSPLSPDGLRHVSSPQD